MLSADFLKNRAIAATALSRSGSGRAAGKRETPRKQFEKLKRSVAPDLAALFVGRVWREAMIASDAALLASGTAVALECMLANARWSGYHEALHLAGETSGENGVRVFANLAGRNSQRAVAGRVRTAKLAEALLPLLANGKNQPCDARSSVNCISRTCCIADEQAADAVPS